MSAPDVFGGEEFSFEVRLVVVHRELPFMVLCHRIHKLLPANLRMLVIPRYWQDSNDSVKIDSLEDCSYVR